MVWIPRIFWWWKNLCFVLLMVVSAGGDLCLVEATGCGGSCAFDQCSEVPRVGLSQNLGENEGWRGEIEPDGSLLGEASTMSMVDSVQHTSHGLAVGGKSILGV